MWLVPLEALTEDQLNAVLMTRQANQVIIGGPGSGKTLVLVHRAHRHLIEGIPAERMKILVYTRVLVDYLKSSVTEIGMGEEIVSTFDSWCMNVFNTYVKGPLPRKTNSNHPDYEQIRVKCLEAVESKNVEPWLDSILVDEGQDLSVTAIKLLNRASKHVTLALDTKQQLYQTQLGIDEVCNALEIKRASAYLLTAYRCTPLIVDLAASFLLDDATASAFKRSNLLPVAGVETPIVSEFDDEEAEFDELFAQLSERALLGQESAVLLPATYLVERYSEAMKTRGLNVVTQGNLSFGELKPMFMTYHSAKGLTVDSVFLPGLSAKNFSGVENINTRKTLFFVGISRATSWVWLGEWVEEPLPEMEILADLERAGSLKRKSIKANDDEASEVEEVNQIVISPNPRTALKPNPAKAPVKSKHAQSSAAKPTSKSSNDLLDLL